MPATFDRRFVEGIQGTNTMTARTNLELADYIREEIRRFNSDNNCDRLVMVCCASTEKFVEAADVHQDLEGFVGGLEGNDENIAPSMIFAYAP